ncbi:MAG: deoxyribose-phosphate aldolase [Halobacteriovoraceae bacterium]|nr:deoxyribose-phosphate aldolase [Halobacteriovoraceae bacterium]
MDDKLLASMIDHTLLSSTASEEEIKSLCEEAIELGFKSVCINPSNIKFAKSILDSSQVDICTVIGFPLGATTTKMKAFETRDAIECGATEIDMVINIGKLKSKDYDYVLDDIKEVVKAASPHIVKVIIETSLLNQEEKVIACSLSKIAKAHFVKTSTGFSGGGAHVKDVELMKRVVGEELEVKASGGIKNKEDAIKMIQAGSTRLGTSKGPLLLGKESANKKNKNPPKSSY